MAYLILWLLATLVLSIVALVRTGILERRLLELKRDLDAIRQPAGPATVQTPAASILTPPPTPTVLPPAHKPPAPLVGSTPARTPSRSKEEWEALIGGKLLNRIGAVALILGVSFFLKYAFDRNWISEAVRALVGAAIGGSLLLIAARSRRKGFQIFAQGLVGAGIAILYLTVYAAFQLYHLTSQPVAFGLMSAVTLISFLEAFRYDSIVVAILGWAGGFLTPFLLATGSDNPVGLFTYLALLDAGLIAVMIRRDAWLLLEPLAIIATWIVFTSWQAHSYTHEDLIPASVFASVAWLLFHGQSVFRISRGISSQVIARRLFGVLAVVVFYPVLYSIVNGPAHAWMVVVTLGFSAVYAGTALILLKKQPAFEGSLMYFIITAIALLAIGTAIQFSGFTTGAFWAVEATALFWAGVHWKKRWIWLAALGLFVIAAVKILGTQGSLRYVPLEAFVVFLNPRAIALGLLGAGCGIGAVLATRMDHPDAFLTRRALHYAWIVSIFLLVTLEVSDSFNKLIAEAFGEQKAALSLYRNMYLSAVWMLFSMPLLLSGLKRQIPPLFLSGIAMIALSIGLGGAWSMSYNPIERFHLFTNVRAALLAFLIVGTVLHVQWLSGIRRRYHRLEALLHFTWGLLLLELCTVETNDYFRHAMEFTSDTVRTGLVFNRFMTLAAVWMVVSLPLVRLGLARKIRPTLYLGLWALLLSFGMAAVRGIAFDPIENYTPLVNYRSIVILLVIAGGLVHANWIRYSGQLFGILYEILNALKIAVIVLILVLLTAETRDFFQKQIFAATTTMTGAALSEKVGNLENLKQISLSGGWLLYSIVVMAIGLWKRNRTFRLISIVLFGVTILKVFFYDLSFLGTLYRIFAFVGLGVILLIVSYLYQRYKAIILEPTPDFDDRKGKAHIVI